METDCIQQIPDPTYLSLSTMHTWLSTALHAWSISLHVWQCPYMSSVHLFKFFKSMT